VTRIVIAAASAVVRAGLEALLSATPGWEVAGSFADASHVESLRPDVLVAALPLGALPVVLNAAANGAPTAAPAIVLLTSEGQPEWTADALRSGVRALLPRDAPAPAILAAVEAAANGLAVIDPQELEGLLGSPIPAEAADTGGAPLTPRELEVLRMMADGAANKEIAWKLAISEHTVKFHVASVMGKLNASSRTEAVTRGLRRGLILM
jgi:two-component system, NarL family, response regulator YdfI